MYEEAYHGRALARFLEAAGGVHMTWGAIQELTTMRGYERLSELAGHPILTTLLRRIMSDESRHFAFYYAQAEKRLAAPGAARLTRFLLERYLRREGLTGPRVFDPREAAPHRADAAGKSLPLGRKPFRLFGKTIAHTSGERSARQRGIFTA